MILGFPSDVIEDTAGKLGVSTEFIEKDLYVTHVIQVLGSVKNDYFKLVFMGGTCLSKAHNIIHRMSEDIDYKMEPIKPLSNTATKKHLKTLREDILKKINELNALGLVLSKDFNCGYDGDFIQIFINYNSLYTNPVSKPTIKIEFTALSSFIPPQQLSVTSLIQKIVSSENSADIFVDCVSVDETAAEKWIALCKRVAYASQKESIDPSDKNLVRHLYDLHCIIQQKVISDSFVVLVPKLFERDIARAVKKKPDFFKDFSEKMKQDFLLNQIKIGFFLLKDSEEWKGYYNLFLNNMVYQKENPSYEDTINTLTHLYSRGILAIEQYLSTQEKMPIIHAGKASLNKSLFFSSEHSKKIFKEQVGKVKSLPKNIDNAALEELKEQLFMAIYKGDTQKVISILTTDSDFINAKNQNGHNLFDWSVVYGRIDIYKLLVEKTGSTGLEFISYEQDQRTPLLTAAYVGEIDVMRYLISISDYKGKELLKQKDRLGSDIILITACYGHVNMMEYLFQEVFDNDWTLLKNQSNEKWNALWLAVYGKQLSMIKFLCDKDVTLLYGKDRLGKDILNVAKSYKCSKEILDFIGLQIECYPEENNLISNRMGFVS